MEHNVRVAQSHGEGDVQEAAAVKAVGCRLDLVLVGARLCCLRDLSDSRAWLRLDIEFSWNVKEVEVVYSA